MSNYKLALEEVLEFIDNTQLTEWNYNGVIDITEILNFHEIAEGYGLTEKEYEKLIDKAQTIGTKKLNSFDPVTGKEKSIKDLLK